MDDFAKRLNSLRQAKGPSARDMSLSLGQAHNYIYSIESGKNYPSMQMFFYICEYLGITPGEFFNYGNPCPYLDDELFREIKKLDGRSQSYMLGLIRDINNIPR